MIRYRTLNKSEFNCVFLAMDKAFSDYIVKIDMDEEAYRRKLEFDGVSFEHSVGAFDDDRLIGATMNAVGYWNGKRTMYDSGTGVIPEYRNKGVGRGMFDFILPRFKENGFKQYLLEAITDNAPALKLYTSLGFRIIRKVHIFRRTKKLPVASLNDDTEIIELKNPNWDRLKTFWSVTPTWQNSVEWILRAKNSEFKTVVLGVFVKKILVGYGVVSEISGKISQLAIDREFRNRRLGKRLLGELQKYTERPLVMTNIDSEATNIIGLLQSNGFTKAISQYEMLLGTELEESETIL